MTKSFTRARDRSLDGPCIEGHKQVPKNVERGLTRLWQIDRPHRGRAFARAIAKADVGVDAMVVFKGQDRVFRVGTVVVLLARVVLPVGRAGWVDPDLIWPDGCWKPSSRGSTRGTQSRPLTM